MVGFKRAEIGRFDGELKAVGYAEGDTIQSLVTKAGLSLSTGEEVNDECGNPVKLTDPAEETTYFITASYKNGI